MYCIIWKPEVYTHYEPCSQNENDLCVALRLPDFSWIELSETGFYDSLLTAAFTLQKKKIYIWASKKYLEYIQIQLHCKKYYILASGNILNLFKSIYYFV